MSLWLESLSLCLYDYEDETESRAKCILSHLSMDIPRSWWEKALETNIIRDSHAIILNDLQKELLNIPSLDEKINSGILVALAFADKKRMEPQYGSDDSLYSIEEYLDKAKEILIERPELGELGRLIDKINRPS
jgi:hypothetical protein